MALKTEEIVLNMGPQHPSTHGVLRLVVELEGELIVNVKPHIGYLHRCFEKHAEAMTYPQVIPYTDRLDYLASMSNNLGYAIAVEKLLKIEIPERVEYIRVLMAELQRIASHLVALGTYGVDIGAFTPFLYCFRDREKILTLFEMTCGARLLYNYIWVGGLSHDIHPDFQRMTKEFVEYFRPKIVELNELLSFNKIFIERTANIGILPVETAVNYGVTGPMLRASGLKWDLRKNDPYSIYDRFDFDIQVGKGEMGTVGDSWDRYFVRVQEMEESLKIIEQAIDQIPEGDVHAAVPRRVKPPKGTVYSRTENPKGELGYFIISDGSVNPARVKVRGPSFVNLSVLAELSKGHLVADLIAILGSTDIVLGEVDR
ncbi:NADH-quinone oxidoreductase subunit 4 [bacterium BMS3Abin04]|nr:NADH-quinone oxidoreductase subunit 4 [bacterium BMS3Abin04]